jgi:hypothetical protein
MSGSQRNYRNCPVCLRSDWKVYVDEATGKWICFAGSCGSRGRVSVDMTPGRLKSLFTRDRGVREFPVVDLPEFTPLTQVHARKVRVMYKLEVPERYLLVSMAAEAYDRVIIPYVRADRSVIYWSTRAMDGAQPKYLGMGGKHPLYIPAYLNPATEAIRDLFGVVLVEGAFDAMSVRDRVGLDAVALGGKYLPDHLVPHLKKYVGDRRITIMLDRDALRDALKLKHRLDGIMPKSMTRVVLCPGSDPASTPTDDLKEVLF